MGSSRLRNRLIISLSGKFISLSSGSSASPTSNAEPSLSPGGALLGDNVSLGDVRGFSDASFPASFKVGVAPIASMSLLRTYFRRWESSAAAATASRFRFASSFISFNSDAQSIALASAPLRPSCSPCGTNSTRLNLSGLLRLGKAHHDHRQLGAWNPEPVRLRSAAAAAKF
eukprot:m.418173 g.418173  ORF g.418173 m.418173 type:complete len:172 (-) comp16834_c0_seq78:239-754(-)